MLFAKKQQAQESNAGIGHKVHEFLLGVYRFTLTIKGLGYGETDGLMKLAEEVSRLHGKPADGLKPAGIPE